MKKQIITAGFILLIYTLNQVSAQPARYDETSKPFQPNKSILFGKDIVIHDQIIQNQRNVVLCSAFNGWLFAAYSYIEDQSNYPSITILKSVDNGVSWLVLVDMRYSPKKLDRNLRLKKEYKP